MLLRKSLSNLLLCLSLVVGSIGYSYACSITGSLNGPLTACPNDEFEYTASVSENDPLNSTYNATITINGSGNTLSLSSPLVGCSNIAPNQIGCNGLDSSTDIVFDAGYHTLPTNIIFSSSMNTTLGFRDNVLNSIILLNGAGVPIGNLSIQGAPPCQGVTRTYTVLASSGTTSGFAWSVSPLTGVTIVGPTNQQSISLAFDSTVPIGTTYTLTASANVTGEEGCTFPGGFERKTTTSSQTISFLCPTEGLIADIEYEIAQQLLDNKTKVEKPASKPVFEVNPTIDYSQYVYLYPSPTRIGNNTNLLLPVEFEIPEDAINAQLFDSKGSLLWQSFVNTNEMEIATRELPKGMYFLKLSYEGYSLTKKVVIAAN